MKQKRKVKSLISQKFSRNEMVLTILLLFLSVILCLGSASLITISVGAAGNDEDFYMTYSGADDRTEVIYGLQFVDPDSLGGKPVNELYMKNGNLYILSNPVKFNKDGVETNIVDGDHYVNILGGEGNYLDNPGDVTIVAGYMNTINGNDQSPSVLGGDENELLGNSRFFASSAVVAGGYKNKIENNDGDVVLGGENNQISGASDSAILGGEENEIVGGKNVIIGGKRVKVNGIDNIFAFSDEDTNFEPESSNAFYLNLSDGVGINVDAAKKGLSVSGAVGFGNIDISEECNDDNIGVEGAWKGCLVACTEVSKNDSGKWELLDRGAICETECLGDSNCIFAQLDTGLQEILDYTGFCVTDHISIENATRCTTGEDHSYENVAFEGVLIDREDTCPTTGNNKCFFRCNPGSHLTGDVAGGSDTVMCYNDCSLPWDTTKKIKHNETVIGYNIDNVACSNDDYKFPYQIDPKVTNGTSPETCGNYNHKKTLICYAGTLYLLKDGKADMTSREAAEKYEYESCDLHNYRCNTGTYNLTQQEIISDKLDGPKNNGSWVVADRKGTLQGVRGQYELCIDYNANPTDPTKNGESCVTNTVSPTPYHYKFKKCQNGYALYSGVCMKDCKIRKSNGVYGVYHHSETVVGYQATGATCTGVCLAANLVCNDGNWRIGTLDGEQTTQYPYDYCTLKEKVCQGNYSVEQSVVTNYGFNSIYDSCDPYTTSGNLECVKQSTKYELTGCNENYHTEFGDESRNKWCIPNTKYVDCDKPEGKYGGSGYFVDMDVLIQWQGGWNTGYWSTPAECEWACNEGYHREGNECLVNWKIEDCDHGGKPENSQYVDTGVVIWWVNGGWTEPSACTWTCNAGYMEEIEDQTLTCVEMDGRLTVLKETISETPEGGYKLGDIVEYKITVRNDGNVTITDIVVTDEKTGDEWTIQSLVPGEEKYFRPTYEEAEEDILAGHIINEATARGTSPDPDAPDVPVTPGTTDDEPVGLSKHLTLSIYATSSAPSGRYALGDTVLYKIVVKNDGNQTIRNITVRDELTEMVKTIDTLAPGESRVYNNVSYVVKERDILAGGVNNVVTADTSAGVTLGREYVATEDKNPHLKVEKVTISTPANGETYALGETITYRITVTNDGNLSISDILVIGEIQERGNLTTIQQGLSEVLAPGESKVLDDWSYVVTEDGILNGEVFIVTTARGTSSDPDVPDVAVEPGEDSEPTEAPKPSLSVLNETISTPANGGTYELGETITYRITVTNDGNLTVRNIVVEDDLTNKVRKGFSLAPGDYTGFETSYIVTQADILLGGVRNEATANGENDSNKPTFQGVGTTEDPAGHR